MGSVYDKYCYVFASPHNLLILQKYTKVQRFVCGVQLNSTNIQLSFSVSSETEYCETTPEITLVTLRYRNVNSVFWCVVLCAYCLDKYLLLFRLTKCAPSLSCFIYILTSFEGHAILYKKALMSSGEGRILFSFNGFLVEVQSLVKQENKSQAMLLFMNPGSHAEMLGGGWKVLGVSLPRGPVPGETCL